MLPRALAITGPTASGKARLGASVAERLGLRILVCDSVKVYRGLDIGSAKPQPNDLYRLIDLVDPDAVFSAGDWARHALQELAAGGGLFVGGTGFYLRAAALTASGSPDQLALGPDNPRRASFEAAWTERERADPGAVHRALHAVDPRTAATIHPNNLVRCLRALWLCEQGPVSELRRLDPPRRRLDVFMVVLDPGIAAVDGAIERRVAAMLAAGWLDEVEGLLRRGYDERHKAMRSLGYKQLLGVLQGRCTLEQAESDIVRLTRHYARRQRTFFRHQPIAQSSLWITDPADFPWQRAAQFLAGEPS